MNYLLTNCKNSKYTGKMHHVHSCFRFSRYMIDNNKKFCHSAVNMCY